MASPSAPARPARGPTVFIGQKPVMAYVFEVIAQLSSGPEPVLVKARGNAIGKAVDVVEVARRKFLNDAVAIGRIEISTERLVNHGGREANVSSIAIPLSLTRPWALPTPPPESASTRPPG